MKSEEYNADCTTVCVCDSLQQQWRRWVERYRATHDYPQLSPLWAERRVKTVYNVQSSCW